MTTIYSYNIIYSYVIRFKCVDEIISKKNRRLKKKLGNSMRTQNKRKDNNRLIKTIRKYKTDD